ncbi:hypothetical protein [Catenuloplanes atrovinosus]|uniref:Uncharacterized protein n=1 Tax=Catenuloplanes atrovinosus TaxID=137266 RepID=A0AAE3YMP4_9ACTN|nr:hypothetical protein [Catenuloplanes atrovinosus]MDR7275902.1 hypothetical protein [Catenuloplanes atrovinosus]
MKRALPWILLAPAVLAWLASLVWPTLRIVYVSATTTNFVPGRSGSLLVRGYTAAFEYGFGRALGLGLTLALLPLLVFLVAGPALGWAGSRAGRIPRLAARCLVVLPLACFVPAAGAVTWYLFAEHLGWTDLGLPGYLRVTVLFSSLAVIVAGASAAYLAAWRGARSGPALLVVTVTGVLAVVASALQQFTPHYLWSASRPGDLTGLMLTHGREFDPQRHTAEPLILAWSFTDLLPHITAAIWVMIFLVVALLGLAIVGLLIRTRARLTVGDAAGPPGNRLVAGIVLGVTVLAVLALAGYVLAPWFRTLAGTFVFALGDDPAEPAPLTLDTTGIALRTWLPPLPGALVSVLTALAGAVAIGVLRPLGDRSELLLLPFAPWLLTGGTATAFANAINLDGVPAAANVVLSALTPPHWLSVPALVLFTLLLRGQGEIWRRTGRPGAFLPVLPAVGLAFGAVYLSFVNDHLWHVSQRGFDVRPDAEWTTMDLLTSVPLIAPTPEAAHLTTPVPLMVLVVAAAVAAQFWLDRITLRTGEPED